ncbi:hypothetical protein INS49_003714 [Diaporthe citri]|uniref:uncharacterized protein n=1 Tax=Diaporthe citri TaxID=83186 RepID=UPI001C813B75|nr:uncharacterized protein INS49_003714 [Diaporthe citri]KAG6355748.1 hypothetical protein INS49_003714 [Diaporthe citri]
MTLNCLGPKSQELATPTEVNVPVHVNNEDVVITDRGGIIENKHRIHAAVVDPEGKLHYAVGDPDRVTLARSAAKPVQALAILETGAADRFHFDDADIALMCASHKQRAPTYFQSAGNAEESRLQGGGPGVWRTSSPLCGNKSRLGQEMLRTNGHMQQLLRKTRWDDGRSDLIGWHSLRLP